ncbi:MAG: methyl-accepting chemotaxis protein [Myxococcota bacterium]
MKKYLRLFIQSPTRDLSIRLKAFGAIAAIVVVVVATQLAYVPRQQSTLLTEALREKGFSLGRLLAHELVPSLEFNDAEMAREVFSGAALDRDFAYGALFGTADEVIARNGVDDAPAKEALAALARQRAGTSRQDATELQAMRRGELLLILAPVESKIRTDGRFLLALSTAAVEAHVASVRRTSMIIAFVFLLFGLIIAFVFGSSLGRRLGVIADLSEVVARGDLSRPPVIDASVDEVGRLGQAFNRLLHSLKTLEDHVTRVAAGDLSQNVAIEGDLAAALVRMIASQRDMVKQIAETAVQVNSTAGEFFANAQQQERGATEQSSSVEETRRTMESLLDSGRQITKTSQAVLQNAERAQQNSQVVAERIAALSTHTHRITEILDVIKDIANKSDLLALNAALEGTKAGEAGRGFSLVANQMQRLAENVMGSVRDIKELTATITEATQSAVLATEESTKLAADTTRSTRQISLIIQQQQSATEDVTKAMDDVSQIAVQTATGSKEIVAATTDLVKLSERLQGLVGRFVLDGSRRPTDSSKAG